MACDAACRWMRGTLRAQVRARSFRTVRLGFLATSRAPQNTPRVPLKGTRGVLHRAILTEKCHLNPTQHAPTTRCAPWARSQATGALGNPNTPQNELFRPILTPCLGPLAYGRYAPSRVNGVCILCIIPNSSGGLKYTSRATTYFKGISQLARTAENELSKN